jgi:hypothetical protein
MSANRHLSKKKVFLAVLIVCAAAAWFWRSQKSAPNLVAPNSQPAPTVQIAPNPPAPEIAPPQESLSPTVEPVKPVAVRSKAKTQKIAQNQPSQKTPKEPLHDPDARDALALVGLDQQAEQYWLQAIFDTNLPDKEREDLMEDLNEVGFADPKNLTSDDLPLIASRLNLIEQIGSNVDPFMKEHLDEAYKDLSNMYAQVAGQ